MQVKNINLDYKILAKISFKGETYELKELPFDFLESFQDIDEKNQKEATFQILERAGIPSDVSRQFSLGALKQMQGLLIGEGLEKK